MIATFAPHFEVCSLKAPVFLFKQLSSIQGISKYQFTALWLNTLSSEGTADF